MPVVISKIFKDQVGKKVFYLNAVMLSWKWFQCIVEHFESISSLSLYIIGVRHWVF